jgi:mannosyltransferase OCH1-like enzyme
MIPAHAHFIWLGESLPWTHVVALESAAARGGFQQIVLHHTDDLSRQRWWPRLVGHPRLRASRLNARELLQDIACIGPDLFSLYLRLQQPAARANVLRAALLYRYGGVYLDTDTVTVASLAPLLEQHTAFCGEERLVFPASLSAVRDPGGFAVAIGRTLLRDGLRRLPDGWRWFRRIEQHYPTAANNAVLASTPGHPFIEQLLASMLELPRRTQIARYALGTAILQRTLAQYAGSDMMLLPPAFFYPIGPEVSEHWFRLRREANLADVLYDETCVVHWYASVRTRKIVAKLDPDWVLAHASRQWFSALAVPYAS